MTFPVDLQADALLRTLVAQNGGDLRAAFAILCARVTVEDLTGETFEQALARAVNALFRRPGARMMDGSAIEHLEDAAHGRDQGAADA